MPITEKTAKVHLDDLHFEHTLWVNELKFMREELAFFKRRLEEIAARYTDSDVLKELEHFQNQFFIQEQAVHDLIHDIKHHEKAMSQYANEHPVALDHVLFNDHTPIRSRMETTREIMNDLKREYQAYLRKWM